MLLPDDVLAEVLRRLAPRSLAVSRGVCRAWRALVDGRRLLRTDLLPLSTAGIFINYRAYPYAEFFSRPCTEFNYCLPSHYVVDHCNGLLLLYGDVLNPATGHRVPLPQRPPPCKGMEGFFYDWYLAFDPFMSSHFEVFLIRRVPDREDPHSRKNGTYYKRNRLDPALLRSEWPPSPCILDVFSSRKGRWEKRSFEREGQAAGTIASMQLDARWTKRHAVYWKGALHVHCQNDFIMRISSSNGTYQVIKPPRGLCDNRELHLGKSEKGLYYALVDQDKLQVWILEESRGQMDWILKHDTSHSRLLVASLNCVQQVHGPWILRDINSGQGKEELVPNKFEWKSDDDDIAHHIENRVENCPSGFIDFLGFHPFKEIVFLHRSIERGLAYHLNSFKIEDLGKLCPQLDFDIDSEIGTCFLYTPCKLSPESLK